MARGTWLDPSLSEIRFDEWVGHWRTTTTNLRPSTRDLYAFLLRRHILPTFAASPIGRITPIDVSHWLTLLQTTGVTRSSAAKSYRLLSRILKVAVRSDYLLKNPCVIEGAGTEHSPEMRVATATEVAALAGAVDAQHRAMIVVADYSSLRWGELAGLRRKDVNQLLRTITVVGQLTR